MKLNHPIMDVEARAFGLRERFVSLRWVFQDHVPISSFKMGTWIQVQRMSNQPKLGCILKAWHKGHTKCGPHHFKGCKQNINADARRPGSNLVVQAMKDSKVVSTWSSNYVWSHHTSGVPLGRAGPPERLLFLMMTTSERWPVIGEILGIIGWDLGVCKSSWLHVDILRFSLVDPGHAFP